MGSKKKMYEVGRLAMLDKWMFYFNTTGFEVIIGNHVADTASVTEYNA